MEILDITEHDGIDLFTCKKYKFVKQAQLNDRK